MLCIYVDIFRSECMALPLYVRTACQVKMPIVLIKLVELHSGIDNVIRCELYALILAKDITLYFNKKLFIIIIWFLTIFFSDKHCCAVPQYRLQQSEGCKGNYIFIFIIFMFKHCRRNWLDKTFFFLVELT